MDERHQRAARTSAWLRGLADDPTVKAVVLRADSPGGDPLPSDLVADAVRTLKAAGKPVVVSQGDVAASGGYWISMDGSSILTTPVTITGSIGVISGWLWDDGLAGEGGHHRRRRCSAAATPTCTARSACPSSAASRAGR